MAVVVRMILIALLLLLIVVLYQKLAPEVQKFWRRSRFEGDWKRLVLLCQGDQERAQRLIEYEKKANPGISDLEACRRAIERYYRDNR